MNDEQRTADMAKACVIISKAVASDIALPVGRAVSLIADALAEQRAEIHGHYAAQVQAADNLSFIVTSFMLGDLDGGDVARAQRSYRDAKNEEVPF